jgi:hypothetical protein
VVRSLLILTPFVIASTLKGLQNSAEDYKLYSLLIRAEVSHATKSVTIIKNLKTDTSSFSWVIDAIRLQDAQQLEQLRFLTRDADGNSVQAIDTTTQNLILEFFQSQPQGLPLTNLFETETRVYLLESFPIKSGSSKEWQSFYKKYPHSGGIFEFSTIHYSKDHKTAIFYHSLHRNGLNAHGALVIMTNSQERWKLKYHINFWQA